MSIVFVARAIPLSRSLLILQGAQATDNERRTAAEVIATVAEPCVKHVCSKWIRCIALASSMPEITDLGQECRSWLFERIALRFTVPEKPESQVEAIFARFCITAMENRFRDVLKRNTRNAVRQAIEKPCSLNQFTRGTTGQRLEIHEQIEARKDGLERDMEEAEILGSLRRVLSPDDFEIAYLRYEGHSMAEIAGILGRPIEILRERITLAVAPALAPRLVAAGLRVA